MFKNENRDYGQGPRKKPIIFVNGAVSTTDYFQFYIIYIKMSGIFFLNNRAMKELEESCSL